MTPNITYLFVYGTLLDRQNEFGDYLNAKCSFYADGKFKGRLYDIGEYPGAVSVPDSADHVYGKIFLVNDPDNVLKRLDDYEGFGANQPQPNEFTRQLVAIETPHNTVECWMYLYNLPVDRVFRIASGDYLQYIKIN